MNRVFIIIINVLFLLNPDFIWGQQTGKVAESSRTSSKKEVLKALNAYVEYVNEVNNYLPIINSLMVDYNMKLNTFVDLPSHQPSQFTNALFPDNLFDDVIFQHSPNALFQKAVQLSSVLPQADKTKLVGMATQFKDNTSYINTSRFEVEQMLVKLDLTKMENITKVYDKMETVAKAFKDSKKFQYELEYQIKTTYKNFLGGAPGNTENIYKALDEVYHLARLEIEAVYENNNEELPGIMSSFQQTINQLKAIDLKEYNGTFWMNPFTQSKLTSIVQKAEGLQTEANRFSSFDNIPEKFNLYGRNYYFYNHAFLVKLNRFGMGVAAEINEIYVNNKVDKLLYFELPYDYKVVYPRKIREEVFLPATATFIKSVPQKVQDREVVKADRVIEVDRVEIEFEVYDHKIIDNDIVSILFNGDWILEKFKINEKKHKFKIKLNESGVNYLLLHAVDEGRRPPATIAINYYANNVKNQIILNSTITKSELIEIVLKK